MFPWHTDALLDEMVSHDTLELRLKGMVYTALTQRHMHPPPSRSRRSSLDESAVAEQQLPRSSSISKPPVSLCVVVCVCVCDSFLLE